MTPRTQDVEFDQSFGYAMTVKPIFLFVYGTLLSGDTSAMGREPREQLAREARVIGAASVTGRLHDLGRYPGLVFGSDGGSRVHGELIELSTPDITLAWLDAYEGIVPGQHAHNEYERRTVEVDQEGRRVEAWIYAFLQPVAGKPLIASGRWLERG